MWCLLDVLLLNWSAAFFVWKKEEESELSSPRQKYIHIKHALRINLHNEGKIHSWFSRFFIIQSNTHTYRAAKQLAQSSFMSNYLRRRYACSFAELTELPENYIALTNQTLPTSSIVLVVEWETSNVRAILLRCECVPHCYLHYMLLHKRKKFKSTSPPYQNQ